MRDLLRSIARHTMKQAGIRHINKKRYTKSEKQKNGKTKESVEKKSFFSLHWREYAGKWGNKTPGSRTKRTRRVQAARPM